MFGPLTLLIVISVLAMLSAGGIAYVALYRRIEAEGKVEKRLEAIQSSRAAVVASDPARQRTDAAKRRKSVQETLKELDEKQKALAKRSTSPPLSLRLEQAGLNWSKRGFYIFSAVSGLVIGVLSFAFGAPIWAALLLLAAFALGWPRWFINFMRKRRIKQFLDEFANAVDVIVRGVKAGLPLNDCIRIIASEAAEPVRTEFRKIIETQALGVPLADAVTQMPERVPVPEANFFAIVLSIQQKSGGNLSEAFGNLSRVLRERKKMKGKIKAMAMEAKASAAIIGSLPGVVMVLVYLSSPRYIMLLFTEPLGNLILVASAIWMGVGILMMRKMINFDF